MSVTQAWPVYGEHDEQTLAQFYQVMEQAEYGALMADGHKGFIMPIGGVAAYDNKVSPVGVGFDIGCGNMAVRLDLPAPDLQVDRALDLISDHIEFGIGQTNPDAPREHPLFESDKWKAYPPSCRADMKKLARKQLGTVGSGNHYVDVFKDQKNRVWVGVHFGSRGLGHKTASGFMNLSQGRSWDAPPREREVLLDLDSELGAAYFEAMNLAGWYARAGRQWVCYKVAELLGAEVIEEVHNHHNFAWKETHFGHEWVVVRKGATPAFPGQKGFVGGSMGDLSVILEGIESQASREILYSTVHGAGRVMSRTRAAGKYRGRGKKRRKIKEGVISEPMMRDWLREKGVKLRGGGLDEAPQVYRRLNEVLNTHQDTINILHTLTPLGVVMAGPDTFDPYKD